MPRPDRSPISSSTTFALITELTSFITPTRPFSMKNGVPMVSPADLRPCSITGKMSRRLLSIAAADRPSETHNWTSGDLTHLS